jgi:hypothetical protein
VNSGALKTHFAGFIRIPCLWSRSKSPDVLLVLFRGSGENEDVVQVREAEVESPQHLVHKLLERLSGVAQAEGHEGNLEKAEGSGYGGLRDIAGMNGNLVIGSHQAYFRIEPATR